MTTAKSTCVVQMLIGYPIGLAVGAVIPPAMVDHQDGHGIDGLLLLQFGMAAVAAVFCFGLSSTPPSAPSATAPYRRGNDNLGRDLKSLRRNFGFMTLCNIWGLSVGAIQVCLRHRADARCGMRKFQLRGRPLVGTIAAGTGSHPCNMLFAIPPISV